MLGAPEVRHIPRVLAEGGIRFLVIEQLPQTKIDGATFWLNGKWPVIVLSLRYDRIDYLWYTVAHEIGHVKHGDGLQIDTDIAEWGESHADIPVEKKADDFATNLLVDQSELNSFINRTRPYYQRDLILGFARRIGVHPGIVVGQLQHRGEVSWNHFRKMLVNVRDSIMETALTDGWGHFPSISA
jgi:HTH-type transcriptional regulator/antitoxin HigA